jgi:putative transposase
MPDQKGSLAEHMISEHSISQRQAYKAVSLPRSSGCYKHKSKADEPVIDQLNKLVEKHAAIGFWQSYHPSVV